MEPEVQNSPSDEIIQKAKQAEEIGSKPFMDPQVKEKKSRGRPKKETSSPKGSTFKAEEKSSNTQAEGPKFDIPTKTLCYLPAKIVSAWGVNYTHTPQAAMSADELEAFATGLGLVIDKHLPDAMKNYGPELMFAMALTQYGVRIMAIKKIQMMNAQKMSQQNQNTTQGADSQKQNRPDGVHIVDTQPETVVP